VNRHIYVVFLVVVSGLGCNSTSPPTRRITIPIDSLYRIDLPSNLKPGYEMHDYASLQYYDLKNQFYVIGLEDSKENLGEIKRKQLKIDGYYDHLQRSAFEHMDSVRLVGTEEYINEYGIHIYSGDYQAFAKSLNDLGLFYRICVLEHPNYFYQLVIWMPYQEYCERISWVDMISSSLRFIPDSVVPPPPLTNRR
jgi:hypothetical protein